LNDFSLKFYLNKYSKIYENLGMFFTLLESLPRLRFNEGDIGKF
jgi:hypothetical protein